LPRRETLHLTHATSYFLPRSTTCARYIESKKQGPFPERTPVTGVITPQLLCEFYLQPVYRAASASFSAHFYGRYFERPSFFLAYASQHLPMLRLRARFKPKPCAAAPSDSGPAWPGGLDSPVITAPPLLYPEKIHHVRASCPLLQPSLEVLLSISNG
jgi:hypothetical protein